MELVVSRKVFVYKFEKISSNFSGFVFTRRWIEPYYVSFSLFACHWIIIITDDIIIVSSSILIFNIVPIIISA